MISSLDVRERSEILSGRHYGAVGPYEKITGFAHFEFDPNNPANKNITDLDKAPTNASGLVEARANFYVFQPVNPDDCADVAILEVVNRGNKTLFNKLNRWTPSAEHVSATLKGGKRGGIPLDVGVMPPDPDDESLFGDFWLMRQGLTVIWMGWEADIIPVDHQMYLEAPCAEGVRGIVRNFANVPPGAKTIPLGQWGHRPYVPRDINDPSLQLIQQIPNLIDGSEEENEVEVPRGSWRFAREEDGKVIDDPTYLYCETGFSGGIYRLVYESEDPPILGLGFAAIRDAISYAKYNDECPFPVSHGISIGRSQTGRFQLDYLYSGVNADEQGRKALDGVMPHTGGAGRGSFNVRFGQPTTGCNHFAQTLFPVDQFPFTAEQQTDPFTGRVAGLYDKSEDPTCLPKVFHVNTGWEYWARANSLLHTKIDGSGDTKEADHERHYFFSCTQHSVEMTPFPPSEKTRLDDSLIYKGNFQDYHFALRSLLMCMVEWVRDDVEPPPSMIPTFSDQTIAHPSDMEFPPIRYMDNPGDALFYEAWDLDYGPRFAEENIIETEPPKRSGNSYPAFVSKVDDYGNELSGIPTLEILVPIATYTPWRNLNRPRSLTKLTDIFTGAVIPFPRTAEEKSSFDDPRPSIDTLYADKDEFLSTVRKAAEQLVGKRLLLADDVDPAIELQGQIWDWVMSRPDYSNA
ncbi:MAG: alpha/beta hydrolase domain-containing protein [Pseudomonadota bacterium]